jgi:NADPH2:quinone reductase
MMRAAIVRGFGAPETIEIGDWPEPEPGPGEVLVSVRAAPVNFVDLLVIGGKYQFLPALPFVPGKGPAGVVTALGEGVDGVRCGDRVLAMAEAGGYAQAVAVPVSQCFHLPDAMSFVDAASISLGFDTAWFALRERGRLRAGEWVLALGASGAVGGAVVQLAKAMGARVLGGIARMEKAASVRAAGADAIIDLSRDDLRDRLRAQVLVATGGHGADVIIDPLGGDFCDAALRALAWCGRLVVVGFAAGRIPELRANYLLVKNIEVSGLQISDYRKRCPARMAECYREIFDWYARGKVIAPPSEVLPLEQAGAALARLRDRRAPARLVLVPQ